MHEPAAPAIVAKALHFTYPANTRPILQGADIVCPRGKVTAIMGGSGCGKTTLLRLTGGLFKPTQGTLTV